MFVAVTVTPLRKVKVDSFSVLTISAEPLSMTVGTSGAVGAAFGGGALVAGCSALNPSGSHAGASRQTDARQRILQPADCRNSSGNFCG
jgi:hypothetical protein